MKSLFVTALSLLFLTVPLTSETLSLKEEMGEGVFAKAGLDKLSADELAVLEAWISGDYSEEVGTAAVEEALPTGEEAFGYETVKVKKPKPEKNREPKQIESRIEGKFTGWNGDEIFLLENGQVWRQTDNEKFYLPKDSPEIIIKKGLVGTYFLRVVGYGSRCKVRRVR